MSQPIALVTNACQFAGPPAAEALSEAGFTVAAHDRNFVDATAREDFAIARPEVRALAEQSAAEVDARAGEAGLDVGISNRAWTWGSVTGPGRGDQ